MLVWYQTIYYEFEHYLAVQHKFNKTITTVQTRVNETGIRKATTGSVNYTLQLSADCSNPYKSVNRSLFTLKCATSW